MAAAALARVDPSRRSCCAASGATDTASASTIKGTRRCCCPPCCSGGNAISSGCCSFMRAAAPAASAREKIRAFALVSLHYPLQVFRVGAGFPAQEANLIKEGENAQRLALQQLHAGRIVVEGDGGHVHALSHVDVLRKQSA